MKIISRNLFIVLLSVFGCLNLMAQTDVQQTEGKKTLYVEKFDTPDGVSSEWVDALRKSVISGITVLERVHLLDAEKEGSSASTGANYIMQGSATSLSFSESKGTDGKTNYECKFSYTLKVLDPKTGVTAFAENYSHGGTFDFISGQTQEDAAKDGLRYVRKDVRALMNKVFKLQGVVEKVALAEDGKAEQVVISLGKAQGVSAKSVFDVYLMREVAGRSSSKLIGKLKVRERTGDNSTVCDVTKGGKEIKEAMDNDQTLAVKLGEKKSLWRGLQKLANGIADAAGDVQNTYDDAKGQVDEVKNTFK